MAVWQQFLIIAGAHFLALLSPGPDFFLIVRSAVINGARIASGVCVGIALANGVYIALAISGVAATPRCRAFLQFRRARGRIRAQA